MSSVDAILRDAAERQRAGAYDAALALYDRVLARQPDHVEALHASGVALIASGRAADGEARLARAAARAPDRAVLANDHAAALRLLGRLDAARDGFRRATALDPAYGEGWHNLGLVELARGDAAEARDALQRAVALAPDVALTQLALGIALGRLGEHEAAAVALETATRLDPGEPRGWANLALSLVALGRASAALAAAKRALEAAPDSLDSLFAVGVAANAAEDFALAGTVLERVVLRSPDRAEAWTALSVARRASGDLVGAVEAGERALALAPTSRDAIVHLARARLERGEIDAARRTLARAGPAGDTDPAVLLVRAHAARAVNDMALAIETFRGVAALQPCLGTATANLLMAMIADDGSSVEAIRAQATRWARACAPSTPAGARSPRATRERLRIGYLSPDLRRHSVAFFLRPLLEAHDRDRLEVFLYSAGTQSDDYTRWFAEHAGPRWRDVAAADDDQAAGRIRGDGIDVLVDLAGHTEGHRLRVFARRPAPVQVSWLGWPSTTGVEAIDGRLTDAIADPPGAERECSERLVRLEGGFLVWRAPAEAPPTARRRDGHPPTFGSFNQAFKLSDATLRLWSRVLAAVPGSRLLIKCASLGAPEAEARLRTRFKAAGGEPDRLEIVGRRLPFADHFALYARVDVGLDPLPYNGTTTTLEALWMGVPVITRGGGDRHAARVGASLLTHAGMDALIAADDDAYVTLARTLMTDPRALFTERARRRKALALSRICDAAAFARIFEAAVLAL